MGLPSSGKGTQAKLLADVLGAKHVSSGEQYRRLMKEDSLLGRRLNEEISKGFLAPAWTAMYFFEQTVFSLKEEETIILDGFGRKLPEAKIIDEVLTWLHRPYLVVHLKVSGETFIERSKKRQALEGRADDKAPEIRLAEYEEHTKPAIEFFESKGLVIEVDGEQTPEEVHKAVVTAIEGYREAKY